MARPPKPVDERRTEVLQLRLTKGERGLMDKGAKAAEQQLSEFVRQAAVEKAEQLSRNNANE